MLNDECKHIKLLNMSRTVRVELCNLTSGSRGSRHAQWYHLLKGAFSHQHLLTVFFTPCNHAPCPFPAVKRSALNFLQIYRLIKHTLSSINVYHTHFVDIKKNNNYYRLVWIKEQLKVEENWWRRKIPGFYSRNAFIREK